MRKRRMSKLLHHQRVARDKVLDLVKDRTAMRLEHGAMYTFSDDEVIGTLGLKWRMVRAINKALREDMINDLKMHIKYHYRGSYEGSRIFEPG